MPALSAETMKAISFIYPVTAGDLVKYLSSVGTPGGPRYPGTIIVSGLHKLAEKSHNPSLKHSHYRQFLKNYSKVSALLTDFCHYFAEKMKRPCSLMIFSKISANMEPTLERKFKLWYHEHWRLEKDTLTFLSGPNEQKITFLLKEHQYYLDSLEYVKSNST